MEAAAAGMSAGAVDQQLQAVAEEPDLQPTPMDEVASEAQLDLVRPVFQREVERARKQGDACWLTYNPELPMHSPGARGTQLEFI